MVSGGARKLKRGKKVGARERERETASRHILDKTRRAEDGRVKASWEGWGDPGRSGIV